MRSLCTISRSTDNRIRSIAFDQKYCAIKALKAIKMEYDHAFSYIKCNMIRYYKNILAEIV